MIMLMNAEKVYDIIKKNLSKQGQEGNFFILIIKKNPITKKFYN